VGLIKETIKVRIKSPSPTAFEKVVNAAKAPSQWEGEKIIYL
jgi:hypothetical protein